MAPQIAEHRSTMGRECGTTVCKPVAFGKAVRSTAKEQTMNLLGEQLAVGSRKQPATTQDLALAMVSGSLIRVMVTLKNREVRVLRCKVMSMQIESGNRDADGIHYNWNCELVAHGYSTCPDGCCMVGHASYRNAHLNGTYYVRAKHCPKPQQQPTEKPASPSWDVMAGYPRW